MIKKYIWIGALSIVFMACQNEDGATTLGGESQENSGEVEQLKAENELLKVELAEKDSTITNYIGYINEIRSNLNLIKDKQRFIINKKANSESLQADDASLVEEIKLLGQLMAENQTKIKQLKSNVKDANIKMDGLDEMILSLTEDVDEKNMEIFQLQQELENVDAAFAELFEAYTDKTAMLNEANAKLNAAYYTIGTKSELLENGVISKEGGVLGIGTSKELKSDFNKSYFTEVSIDAINEIPLGVKKVDVITTHPSTSYELIGENPVEKLVIKNAEEFWSVSKYLVVLVK
ncbi:MAG: hypothetical protein N4A35_16085 [Flavobacteriales bacterium]|jgi:DNA repair exonuclease SbcCD ATPase subunit|nr:hypothetical protein [Flavobacteriales bacterium]